MPNTTNSANLAYIAAGEMAVNLVDLLVVGSNGTTTFYVGANVPTQYVGGVFLANSTVVNLGSSNVAANGADGSAGQSLVSNGGASYWGTAWNANNATNLGGTAAAGYQTTAGLSANVAALSANNASYLGTVAAAAYVQNTMNGAMTGNVSFSGANVTFSGANLWVSATNTYFSGLVTHAANVALGAAAALIANASPGANGTVLGSNGSSIFWANAASVRQQFSGTGACTVFAVTGGFANNYVDVFINGIKMYNGTDVTVSASPNVVFGTAPPSGALIDVIGPAGVGVNWSTVAGGSTTQIQYNSSGTLSGSAGLTWDAVNTNVTVSNGIFFGTGATNCYSNTATTIFNTNSTANLWLSTANVVLNINSSVSHTCNATQMVTVGLANVTLGAGMLYTTANLNVQSVLVVNTSLVNAVPNVYTAGIVTHAGNVVLSTGIALIDSTGAQGTAGQVLLSNGAANVYWGTVIGVNSQAQYTFTNTETFSSNVVIGGNLSINTTANPATLSVGNSLVNSTVNAYGVTTVSNTTANVLLTATNVVLNVNSSVYFAANATGIYTTANTFTLGTSSVAANGYTRLPNGLLMQWGKLAVNSSTAAQTWPTAFVTNAYSVTATSMTVGANVVVTTCNTSKFTILTAAAANVNIFWTAVGQ